MVTQAEKEQWADALIGKVVNQLATNGIPGLDVWHYDDGVLKLHCDRGSVLLRVDSIVYRDV